MDYKETATNIFQQVKYKIATGEDIAMLAENMRLLKARGLGELNKRLSDCKTITTFLDTIAEHNFAVSLISRHCANLQISYEPKDYGSRPPDFKVILDKTTFWIQIKNLAKLERENRQHKILQKITNEAKKIKVGKFFECWLSDNFNESSIPELMDFIEQNVSSTPENEYINFQGQDNQQAKLKFWAGNAISELTLGISGDLEIVELTGKTEKQIKESLTKAAGAFTWNANQNNINLIVMEADNQDDISICDALYGTESHLEDWNGYKGWERMNNGLFIDVDFSPKVAGVIAIKRKKTYSNLSQDQITDCKELALRFGIDPAEYCKRVQASGNINLISDYHMNLYINNSFEYLADVKRLLFFDNVIYPNMRTPWGKGNFSCLPTQ